MLLVQISENLWIYEGETVSFFHLPYSTRMTVIRLSDQRLWIHSPVKLSQALQDEIEQLGKVSYLIAPNKLHHLFLLEWIARYPEAESFAAPGLQEKRSDIQFTKLLNNDAEIEWCDEIEQLLFKGSPAMEEVVFFHKDSKTLILTDLIENFDPTVFNGWQRVIAKLTGIVAPKGKTPIDWRLSFVFGKKVARPSLQTMLDWQPDNIIIAHGKCIFGQGTVFLRQSFSWLL